MSWLAASAWRGLSHDRAYFGRLRDPAATSLAETGASLGTPSAS